MIGRAKLWARYIKVIFIKRIEDYSELLNRRILPSFNDIEKEAVKIEERVFEEMSTSYNEYMDLSEAADTATEDAVDYYVTQKDLRQGILNMFAIALYHLFEQQCILFLRRELLSVNERNNNKLMKFKEFESRLKKYGIKVRDFKSYKKVEELQLVANVTKHAEGRSSKKLELMRPDLFENPNCSFNDTYNLKNNITIYEPLFGQDLYTSSNDLNSYAKSIKDFWTEFINCIN